jgi:hypothetical protein
VELLVQEAAGTVDQDTVWGAGGSVWVWVQGLVRNTGRSGMLCR